MLEISFADDGPGIPADLRERIFEPFFSTKKEGEGTGLGLYICRSIIEEHQGTLSVDDRSEGGATFYVRLPLTMLPIAATDDP
jgi:signal transduction histidine kinase